MWGKQSQPKPNEAATPAAASPRPVETRADAGAPPAPAPRSAADGTATSRITAGISIAGEITGRENVYLDGEVQGSVRITDASVTVGPKGRVEADVEAREIEVHGRVRGTLEARDRVRIGATGSVRGEIVAQRIAIEEGAIFCGSVDMVRPGEARSVRAPEAPRAAAAAAGASVAAERVTATAAEETDTSVAPTMETEEAIP